MVQRFECESVSVSKSGNVIKPLLGTQKLKDCIKILNMISKTLRTIPETTLYAGIIMSMESESV